MSLFNADNIVPRDTWFVNTRIRNERELRKQKQVEAIKKYAKLRLINFHQIRIVKKALCKIHAAELKKKGVNDNYAEKLKRIYRSNHPLIETIFIASPIEGKRIPHEQIHEFLKPKRYAALLNH